MWTGSRSEMHIIFETFETENKYKSSSLHKISLSDLRSFRPFSKWFGLKSVWVAFSIDNSTVTSSKTSKNLQTHQRSLKQHSSEQVAVLESVALDLNFKIEGTAFSVCVCLVLPTAFLMCSSLKWYLPIMLFLLDRLKVSPQPLLQCLLIALTQLWCSTFVLFIFRWKHEQTYVFCSKTYHIVHSHILVH